MTARLTRRLEDVLWRLPPLATGAALLAGVAVVVAVCWSTTFDRENVPLPNHRFLDLNAERSLPAAFSAALLVFSALTAVAWGRRRRPAAGSTAALLLGCLFAFFAVDEFAFLHERLEKWLDIDWQVLYLPLAAAAAPSASPPCARCRARGRRCSCWPAAARGSCRKCSRSSSGTASVWSTRGC